MNLNKYRIICLFFLLVLVFVGIGVVSATNTTDSDDASVDTTPAHIMKMEKDLKTEQDNVNNYNDLKRILESTKKNCTVNLDNSRKYYSSGRIYINAHNGNITINGNGAVIDGKNTKAFLNIMTKCNVWINNLTIQNMYVVDDYGGAIHNSGTLNVKNCYFLNNQAKNGGAISTINGVLNIENSVIKNNTAEIGSALYTRGSYVNLNNTNITYNNATEANVFYIEVCNTNMTNNRITNNTCEYSLINLINGSANIIKNDIKNNTVKESIIVSDANLNVINNTFKSNYMTNGVVLYNLRKMKVDDNIFDGNHVKDELFKTDTDQFIVGKNDYFDSNLYCTIEDIGDQIVYNNEVLSLNIKVIVDKLYNYNNINIGIISLTTDYGRLQNPVINGVANIILSTDFLTIGSNTIHVKYECTNNDFRNCEQTFTVNLYRDTHIDIICNDTVVSNELTNISFRITDINNKYINNECTVTVTIGMNTSTLTTYCEHTLQYKFGYDDTYTIKVEYSGDTYYQKSVASKTVNTLKYNTDISTQILSNKTKNTTLDIDVQDEKGLIITDALVDIILPNGTTISHSTLKPVTLELPEKTNTLKINFTGMEMYRSSYTTVDVDVEKTLTSITAEVINTTVDNVTVKVELKDEFGNDVNGAIVVLKDENNETISTGECRTSNGIANILTTINETGLKKITAVYYGNDTYSNCSYTITDTMVTRRETSMNVAKVIVDDKISLEVTLTDTATREGLECQNIILTDSDLQLQRSTTDKYGKAEMIFDLSPGKYILTVKYEGNDRYDDVHVKIIVVIEPYNTTLTAKSINTTLFNTTVEVTLTNTTTTQAISDADITFVLPNGENIIKTTDSNGRIETALDLPVGDNNILITYPGNQTYNASTTTLQFKVKPRQSRITAKVTNNTSCNVTITANLTDAETNENITGGLVIVKVHDRIIGNATVDNGKVNITTNITENGVYDLIVEYGGTENYTAISTSIDDLLVVGRLANMTATTTNNILANTTIEVNLKDLVTNKAISNANIIITLPDNSNVTGTTDNDGSVDIHVNIPVGSNKLNVTYLGNKTYNATNIIKTINVLPRESITMPQVANNTAGNLTIDVTVSDKETGIIITNGNITVKTNNTIIGQSNITKQVTSIETSITEIGSYDILVIYDGSENYTTSNTTLADVEVVGRQSSINAEATNTILANTTVKVTLTDSVTKEGITSATISVTLPNAITVNKTTDENGIVEIPFDLPVGDNKLNITYPGDKTYNKTSTELTVTVKPRQTQTNAVITNKTAGNVTIKVRVSDAQTGATLEDSPVTIYIDDTVVGNANISNAKTSIVTNVNEIGTYDFIIVYTGNENYTTSNTTLADVEVVGRKSNITAEATNTILGETIVIISLTDMVTGEPLANANITLTDDSGNLLANMITDDMGEASIILELPVGENKITAIYNGNDTFNPSNDSVLIVVDKKDTSLNVNVDNTTLNIMLTEALTTEAISDALIIITLPDTSQLNVTTLSDGSSSIELNLLPGVNVIRLAYDGNETYNPCTVNVSIDVDKYDTHLNLEVLNNTVDNVTVTIGLLDDDNNSINSSVNIILPDSSIIRTQTQTPTKLALNPGEHVINITTPQTDYYKSAQESTTINVTKRDTMIELEFYDRTVGHVKMGFAVRDIVTKKAITGEMVDIFEDDKYITSILLIPDSDDSLTSYVTNLSSGLHDITLVFNATDKYNNCSISRSINVSKILPSINASYVAAYDKLYVESYDTYNNKAITNKNISIIIDYDKEVSTITDADGRVISDLFIPAGNHSVEIRQLGDEIYENVTLKYNEFVEKRNTTLDVEVLNSTYNSTRIKVTLKAQQLNNTIKGVKILLYDQNNTLQTENVTDTYTILNPLLPRGKQTINIVYEGDDNYNPSNITTSINIEKRPTEIVYSLRNNSVGNTKLLIYVKDLNENLPLYNGYINITLADGTLLDREPLRLYSVITADLPITNPGQYTIVMNFEGNDDYYPSTYKIENATIRQIELEVDVDILDKNLNNTTLNITLHDKQTNDPVANTPLNITLPNGTNITVKSDENGTIILPVDTTIGNSTITINTEGQADAGTNIPIEITPIDANVTVNITEDSQGQNVLNIDSDVPLSNGSIVIKDEEGNIIESIPVDENTTQVVLDIPPEYKNVTIEYTGDSKVETPPINVPVNTEVLNTTMNVDDVTTLAGTTIQLKAHVYDQYNKTVNSGYVIFKINGLTIKDAWDDPYLAYVHNSTAVLNYTVPINLKRSTYNISAVYSGYKDTYNSVRDYHGVLTVNKRTMNMTLVITNTTAQLKDKVTFNVKLQDNQLKINFGKVIFKINGQTIKNKKNETIMVDVRNNTATYTFTIPEYYKARNYTVTAVYIDENYPRCETNTTLTVEKTPVTIMVDNSTIIANNVHITGRILDKNGELVKTRASVSFKVNGLTQKNSLNVPKYFDVVNGKFNINTTINSLHEGTHNLTVMMQCSSAYTGKSSNNTTITVIQPDTNFEQVNVTYVDNKNVKTIKGQIFDESETPYSMEKIETYNVTFSV